MPRRAAPDPDAHPVSRRRADGDLARDGRNARRRQAQITARALVNAGGPGSATSSAERHPAEHAREGPPGARQPYRDPRLYDHDKCYFFQGTDGRIIFAIPYETDFTLIGTTDQEHRDPRRAAVCTPEERDYLLRFANQYFRSRN
jgi:glycerol-3-phosphate dehydrogenase